MRVRRWVLFAVAAVLVALAFLRLFFFGVYQVESASMEPAIHGDPSTGERVLVRYGRARPERFDLVVVRVPGEDVPRVKRVAALPGEGARIEYGDLVIDGERLGPDAPRPEPIAVYDPRLPLGDHFRAASEDLAGWTRADDGWRHDGAPDVAVARLEYARLLTDSYIDRAGSFVEGSRQVGDLWIGARLELESDASRARLAVAAQGDRFLAWIGAASDGVREVQLYSLPVPGQGEGDPQLDRIAGRTLTVTEGPHEWVLGRVDGRVELWLDGERVLEQRFGAPRLHPLDLFGEGDSHGPRAWIEVGGGGVNLSDLRLWRDVHYTARGEFAVREELTLGPDELLLLGDHSAHSRDGRDWGPLPIGDLIGRPVAVVSPFGAARALPGGVDWAPRFDGPRGAEAGFATP